MMSRHFALSLEISGAIAKRLRQAKNQLSTPGSFFNQFDTDILTIKTRLLFVCLRIYIYICKEMIEETAKPRKLIFSTLESFGYGSSKF